MDEARQMEKGSESGAAGARVDVVVVTHQSAASVGQAVRSVRSSRLVGRVVVVDSGSTDASADAAREAGADEVVVLGANLGFAAGVGRGLAALAGGGACGSSEFVLLLNPDAVLEPGDLARLVAALDEDGSAVIAGPMLSGEDGRVLPGGRRFSTVANRLALELPWLWRRPWAGPEICAGDAARGAYDVTPGGNAAAAGGAPRPVDYVWGAALLARGGFLRAVGGLDERYFLYHEDEDLGRRARFFGRRVLLVPGARARHVGAASSGGDAALAQARLLFATTQVLDKWSWPGAGRVFALGARAGLGLQALAGLARGDGERARGRLRCARLFHGFVRAGSARPGLD